MTIRPQPDDPDDPIEPLLRAAAAAAGGSAASGRCLDPDAIASWADGRLARSEAAALEAHAASCARCRAVLTAFAQTMPAAAAATPATPWWKAPALRWAAPLAGMAGAALVWVAVDRAIDRGMESPAGTSVSVRSAPAERDLAQGPAVAPPPPASAARGETPAGRAPQGQARSKTTDAPVLRPSEPVRVEAGSPPAAAARADTAERPAALAETVLRGVAATLEVHTPDPKIRWRFGPGLAERSDDGGASWTAHTPPAPGQVTAAACPAVTVCWLAGPGGVVLRTADGETWTRATPPDPADIISIAATDALTAVVTTADGRTFVTSNGGQTWFPRPLQELPAAPF